VIFYWANPNNNKKIESNDDVQTWATAYGASHKDYLPPNALRGCFELLEGKIGDVNGGPIPEVRSHSYEFARSIIFGELRKAVQTLFVDMDDLEKAMRDNRIKGDECAKKDALDERALNEEAYQASIDNLRMVGADAAGAAFNLLGQFAEDNKALQVASILGEAGANAAKIIMSTNVANMGAKATPDAILTKGLSAVPVIAANNIAMGIGLANTAAAAVQGITALGGSGAPDTSGEAAEGGGSVEAPSFNLVEGSEGNQIQNSIESQNDVPLKAYVVAQDVTSQQSLDRQIESNSGI
jgi:hypothetical protein